MSVSRPDRNGKPPRRQLTARRKWTFRAIAAIVIPTAVLLIAELALVAVGYGTSSSFFTKITGRDAWTTNQIYGWRFFPRPVARRPFPCDLPGGKSQDTYRIFVLGGSAAAGMPEQAFAFGRVLQAMLEQSYPQTKFEVINAAMTAINSHVVRHIADDCADHDPDVFVVYMGNNEVVGPYGPGTVFGGFSDSLSAIRFGIAARSTRLGQLLRETGERAGGKQTAWEGMGMFMSGRIADDDQRLEATYAHLRQNLLDICQIADRAGADVILCTVPSNLKDSPPFESLHRADLAEPNEAKWQKLYDKAVAFEKAGNHAEAIETYLAAVTIDDKFAELRFHLARCYLATGDRNEARQHYIAARDLDALRFRADTRINQTIREVADSKPDGVRLADVVAAMAPSDRTGDGIPGNEFFYEHVHLSFDGNYVVGSTVFQTLAGLLPESIRTDRSATPAVPSQADCAERLAFDDWAHRRLRRQMMRLTSEALFAAQLDHDIAQRKRARTIDEISQRLASPDAMAKARETCFRAAADNPDDLDLARLVALFLSETGDDQAASQQWRELLTRVPNWANWQIELGTALTKQGEADEAVKWLEPGLNALPYDLGGRLSLGIALMQLGKTEQGIGCFRRVLKFAPRYMPAHSSLGRALLREGNVDEAAIHLRRALKLGASSSDAYFNMGVALLALDKTDEAVDMFRRTLQLDPNHTGAQKGLSAAGIP